MQHHYITEVCRSVLGNKKVVSLLKKAFTEKYETVASEMTSGTCKRAIASIVVKRLVNRVLRLCKHYDSSLLRSIRSITKIVITEKGDMVKVCTVLTVSFSFMNLPTSILTDQIA